MSIDDFAPNLSFFFSNGMDPEYTVLGRVARRIWAVAMRERYGADERSQKLKYHVQTSGRSLHAQEMSFNDIRTTLQALIAIYDNCNSLHTNAYDEAVTTPTAESVRRALAIQMIINQEWGLAKNENPLQGSFIIEQLTDLVEEAVLSEFERISERGGVLGAMETGYQRGRIQDESMLYEQQKHDGTLPIIGVNTFRNPNGDDADAHGELELARSTDDEKQSQLRRLRDFQARHANERPAMLARLRDTAHRGRQPVRGADGRGALLLARRDHHGAVRRGRALPPQRLTSCTSGRHPAHRPGDRGRAGGLAGRPDGLRRTRVLRAPGAARDDEQRAAPARRVAHPGHLPRRRRARPRRRTRRAGTRLHRRDWSAGAPADGRARDPVDPRRRVHVRLRPR